MSSYRQNNLLRAEDWKKIYQAATNVNFQTTDFASYRTALVDYLRTTYPEDFQDWINNSEMVMLLDMTAYVAFNLAFKMDLNSHNNVIELAEDETMVLNLANTVGYYPSRNLPARSLAKIVSISTTEDVKDIDGSSLKNVLINWNDSTNTSWFDQFIKVLNSTFILTNPFGSPVKKGTVGDVNTYSYQIDSELYSNIVYPFTATINNTSSNFEVVNPDFNDAFFERAPSPENAFNLIYRNDGTGNSSNDTGFFVYFKQGTLGYNDYNFSSLISNRTVDISVDNINDLDVWVHEINSTTGKSKVKWTKVDSADNVYFNDIGKVTRTIYEVKTKQNDNVQIKFADGIYGDIPIGTFRVWYRTSLGASYTITTNDIDNVTVSVPYVKNDTTYLLKLTFSLMESVTNSATRETIEQIKQRAPQVSSAQKRMVTGDDYNVYPLKYGSSIKKLKAINRTFAGHSRYIDLNDPTGTYQNTNIFSEDGLIYKEDSSISKSEPLPTTKTVSELVVDYINPLLSEPNLVNFYYNYFPNYTWIYNSTKVAWKSTTVGSSTSTGNFVDSTNSNAILAYSLSNIKEETLVRLVNGATITTTDSNYKEVWVKVVTINTDGTIIINEPLDSSITWYVDIYYPTLRHSFNDEEVVEIESQLSLNNSFGIRYDQINSKWIIVTDDNLDTTSNFSLSLAGDNTLSNKDSSWLILVSYSSTGWTFKLRTLMYVFESLNDVRFFYDNSIKVVDINTSTALNDYIKILRINSKASNHDSSLGSDYTFTLVDSITYNDGYIEPRRIQITLNDSDNDGTVDNPLQFVEVVEPVTTQTVEDNRFLFWTKTLSTDGYYYYIPTTDITIVQTTVSGASGTYFIIDTLSFVEWDGTTSTTPSTDQYYYRIGRQGVIFQWKHYANLTHRIDPSPTNIIDLFVLTNEYYDEVQTWMNTTNRGDLPTPPDSSDLMLQFSDLNLAKTTSDEIVWHPVTFKLLFGSEASSTLQANFKIVKTDSTQLTDNGIKTSVISYINKFFDVDNWSFSETFSFTELSTYIHQNMLGDISQIVIVPSTETLKFGNLFQIRSESNELFLSTATVNNVQIVSNLNDVNMRIGN